MKHLKKSESKGYSITFCVIAMMFVVCILVSNITAGRLFTVFNFTFPASILIFPISYVIGTLITELFGFTNFLKVMVTAFIANLFLISFCYLAINLPPGGNADLNTAYKMIFCITPRIFIGSLLGFIIGGLANASTLTLLKRLTKSKHFWLRAIVSTVVSEVLDSIIFLMIVFIGVIPIGEIWKIILFQATFKITYETVLFPILLLLIKRIKDKKAYSGLFTEIP